MLTALVAARARPSPCISRSLHRVPAPSFRSAVEIAAALRTNQTTASQHAQLVSDRVHAAAGPVCDTNCFISVVGRDRWLAAAAEADARIRSADGCDARPLEGLAVALKDCFATAELPTTCASSHLRNYQSPIEATVASRLLGGGGGGMLIGKTNLDEFSMGSDSVHSSFGPVRNPVDHGRVAGGSSGGSAVAVALGAADIALGTDTGGSVRMPAALCGVVGFKPSYGRVSRYGLVAYGSSLDTPSLLTRTVADSAFALEVLCAGGPDPHDPTATLGPRGAAFRAPPELLAAPLDSVSLPARRMRGVRIGLVREANMSELSGDTREAWQHAAEVLRRAGAEIVHSAVPHLRFCLPAYYILALAEASSNLSRFDGIRYGQRLGADEAAVEADAAANRELEQVYRESRGRGLGAEVQRRILLGAHVLSRGAFDGYYQHAARVRTLVVRDFDSAFDPPDGSRVDALLMPVATGIARPLDQLLTPAEEFAADALTTAANLAGLPAIAVPVGRSSTERMPLGMQLVSRRYDEARLLRIAHALEQGCVQGL